MFRTIFLLGPVYVSLFWAIMLIANSKKHSTPRVFLSWFMLFPFIIFLGHFLYFAPLPEIYPYFETPMYMASIMVFPMYHIYFRLLTIDEKFSLKKHAKYLIPGMLLIFIYGIALIFTPKNEYRIWLYDNKAFPHSASIQFLATMRQICKFTYLIQVVLTVIANYLLIKKYGDKAEDFYSDIQDGKYNNAKMLNNTIVIMGVSAFVIALVGRYLVLSLNMFIYIGWSVFSLGLYLVGYMGLKQKPVNPTYDSLIDNELTNETIIISDAAQLSLINKLENEFRCNKIHLNSELNILDVVTAIGSNRTYISLLINQKYNQNFCSFVNNFRIEEMKQVLVADAKISNEKLADSCGFGSVSSMKRAVLSNNGLSIADWKKQH
jgi:AraC-like DNA-binding protein